MTDKQQIEEMKDEICKTLLINGECSLKDALYYREAGIHIISEALYNANYRRVPENAVVLTRETWFETQDYKYELGFRTGKQISRRQTAREILKWLVDAGVINTAPDTTKMYFKEQFGVEVEE